MATLLAANALFGLHQSLNAPGLAEPAAQLREAACHIHIAAKLSSLTRCR